MVFHLRSTLGNLAHLMSTSDLGYDLVSDFVGDEEYQFKSNYPCCARCFEQTFQ